MRKILFLLLPFLLFAKAEILAISWQKSFCKLNHSPECKYSKNYDYFTLHGVWVKKEYCKGVKNFRLPNKFWRELKKVMPSTKLIKHEWRKHGTCYSKDPFIYFRDSLKLLNVINSSPILKFFRDNEGKIIRKEQLNRVINRVFPNSARKVKMICKSGYVVELRFSLNGDIEKDSFYQMLKKGKNLIGNCEKGRIAE